MAEFYSIGKKDIRLDALEKVTGEAMYSGDFHPKGMLYGKVLASPIPHGIIKRIDTSKAEKLPGVVAVATGKDGPGPVLGVMLRDKEILCSKKVRCVGDPVAAVAATSEKIANAALKLIEVEYEPLPYIFDPEAAYSPDCEAVIHENLEEYQKMDFYGAEASFDKEHPNMLLHRKVRHGDVEKGFEEAEVILDFQRYDFPLVSQGFMEPHASTVVPHSDGSLEVWTTQQVAKMAKFSLCGAFRLPPSMVKVHIPYVGGGFGGRASNVTAEIAATLAVMTKRPVQIAQTRLEVFYAGMRPSATIYVRDGYKKDGTLTAREIKGFINCGAYSSMSLFMAYNYILGAMGSYKQPNLKLDSYGVCTNTPPTSPYRALGSELMTFVVERNMDKAAKLLGIDPVELRRRNLLEEGDIDGIEHVTQSHVVQSALNAAAEAIKWSSEKKADEGSWRYGKGLAVANKFTLREANGCEVMLTVLQDGMMELRTFHIEMGQGSMTVDAQHVAEAFKIPLRNIKVLNKEDDSTCWDEGCYDSRGTFVNGTAVILACNELKQKIFEAASAILRVPSEQLDTANSMVFEIGNEKNCIPFAALYMPGGWRPGSALSVRATFTPPEIDKAHWDPVEYYSHGVRGAEVKVNVETGEVRLINSVGFYDCGQVINLATCEGQVEGCLVMGYGQSVLEEAILNDKGEIINGNFRDYKIPTFMDMPNNEEAMNSFIGIPFEDGPNGAKGVGEVGQMPVMPTIANAISNAIGVEMDELPMTRERILAAIRKNAY